MSVAGGSRGIFNCLQLTVPQSTWVGALRDMAGHPNKLLRNDQISPRARARIVNNRGLHSLRCGPYGDRSWRLPSECANSPTRRCFVPRRPRHAGVCHGHHDYCSAHFQVGSGERVKLRRCQHHVFELTYQGHRILYGIYTSVAAILG